MVGTRTSSNRAFFPRKCQVSRECREGTSTGECPSGESVGPNGVVLWRQEPVQCQHQCLLQIFPSRCRKPQLEVLGWLHWGSGPTSAVSLKLYTITLHPPVTENQTERVRKREEGRIRFIFSQFEDVLGKAVGHVTSQSGSRRDEYWWPGFLSLCQSRQQPGDRVAQWSERS